MNVITYNDVYLFFLLSVFFVNFQTAFTVAFKKFRRDLKFDGLRCVANDTIFQEEKVSTSVECSKICHMNKLCDAFYYQPDLLTCIGCAGICHGVEVFHGSTSFVQDHKRGWIDHRYSCYFFSSDKKSWTNALEACRKMGGDLVEVNDVIEHNFLMSKAPPLDHSSAETGYWIGLTDKDKNDTFVWISSGQIPTFTLWRDDEPSHDYDLYDEDCASYYGSTWNDLWCEHELHYICERTLL